MASEAEGGTRAAPRPALIALFCVAVAASLVLRWPRLTESLWYDEQYRTRAVLHSDRVADLFLHDVHNPLYNAFMYVWVGVFGDSEIVIRLPSLLAGYLSLGLFCSLLRRRMGIAAAACVALWCLVAPMHLWYCTEAKNNMFVLAFATLALWSVDRMVERPTKVRTAFASFALVAAFYTDLVAVLVITPLILWTFGQSRRAEAAERTALRRAGWVVTVVTLACATPWAVFKAMHVHQLWRGYLEPFRPREVVELLGGMFMTGHAFAPLTPTRTWVALGVFILILPLLALGGRTLWRAGRARVLVLLMMFGMGGMALASAVVDALYTGREHYIYQPRNLLCLLYVFAAILWVGVTRVRPVALRAAVGGVLMTGTLAASVCTLTVHADRYTVDKPRSDWREVVAVIESDAGDAAVVAVSRSPVQQLEHYSEQIDTCTTWGEPVEIEDLEAAEASAESADEDPELYYVSDLDWWPVLDTELEQWRKEYVVREVGRVDRVVIYALDPR